MRKFLILLTLLISFHLAHSETIIFKDGKTIDAPILERTEEYIKVDIGGIGIKYYLDEIEKIDGASSTQQLRAKAKKSSLDEKIYLKVFSNEKQNIRLPYPEGWYQKEYHPASDLYILLLSREEVKNEFDSYAASINFLKQGNQVQFEGLTSEERLDQLQNILNQQIKGLTSKNVKVEETQEIIFDGEPAILKIVSCEGTGYKKQFYKKVYYYLATMKDTTFVQFGVEVPASEYQYYRPIFDEILRRSQVFSPLDNLPETISVVISKTKTLKTVPSDDVDQSVSGKKMRVKLDLQYSDINLLAKEVCGFADEYVSREKSDKVLWKIENELAAKKFRIMPRYDEADLNIFVRYRDDADEYFIQVISKKTSKAINSFPFLISDLKCERIADFLSGKMIKGLEFADELIIIRDEDIIDFEDLLVQYILLDEGGTEIVALFDYYRGSIDSTVERPEPEIANLQLSLREAKEQGKYRYNLLSEDGNRIFLDCEFTDYTHEPQLLKVTTNFTPSTANYEKVFTLISKTGCDLLFTFTWKDGEVDSVMIEPKISPFYDSRIDPFYDHKKGYF